MIARVLVVDDSFLPRNVLSDILKADATIEVVGVTESIDDAIGQIDARGPDLVLVDALLPGMGGGEPIRRLIARFPDLPVLVILPSNELGEMLGARMSATGAATIQKPPSFLVDCLAFITELRARIHALVTPRPGAVRAVHDSASFAVARAPATVAALVIGSATGGSEALTRVFARLPRTIPVPIFIAQHMPAIFTRMLADRLRACTGFPVDEAKAGASPRAGHAYLAPGDFHLRVVRSAEGDIRMTLDQGPLENGCRPAVDILFRSVARSYGANALAVLLDGTGTDGVRGADAIARAGGRVLSRDDGGDMVDALIDAVAPLTATIDTGRRPYGKTA